MARERSPDVEKAEKLFQKGVKIADIAKRMGVAPNTISTWKARYNWDESNRKENVRKLKEQQKAAKSQPRKRGGQKNNLNAIGSKSGGAPKGSHNALKHGAYSNPHLAYLDEDEKSILESIPRDEEALMIQQIGLLTIRENRILKAIKFYRDQSNPLVLERSSRSETKRKFNNAEEEELYNEKINERIAEGERLPGQEYVVNTITENKDNLILRLERELTSVQRAKTKCIESLHAFTRDKIMSTRAEKMFPLQLEMLDAQIESIDANTQRLLGANIELEDTTEADQLIYGGSPDEEET